MGPTIKMLLLLGVIYFLTRRLLKPFREYKQQVKQQSASQHNNTKNRSTTKTDDLGDYIDYEEIEE